LQRTPPQQDIAASGAIIKYTKTTIFFKIINPKKCQKNSLI
jgi:hypothetical protein